MRLVIVAIWATVALGHASTIGINIAWLPVTDAERQMKTAQVEKDAGVEALFWRVHVLDERDGQDWQRVLYHYVRLKIFNQDGKEKAATIDIQHNEKTFIMDVAGRTIQADGSIVELSKDAVHDRVLSKAGHSKQTVTSFAMPGVEVGSILEYRWKEVRVGSPTLYLPLQLQREYPVERVTYFVKPLAGEYTSYRMSLRPFNCNPSPIKLENDGFNSTHVENVPAFHEEPMMPGAAGVRQWILVYYHQDDPTKRDPERYWSNIGKKSYSNLKQSLKLNGELKEAAAGAIAGAKTDEEKCLALIRYVRANVRDYFSRSVSDAERAAVLKKMPKDRERTSTEVVKSGIGTPDEMNTLFAGLASAAGLEARPALISDRNELMFDQRLTEQYFLRHIDMAVQIDGKWKLYDVSADLLPAGMLGWQEEGARALIADSKTPEFITTPISPPEASRALRYAKFNLSADGSLEGDVTEIWTGHTAYYERLNLRGESADRQLEQAKEELATAWPTAEVSDIRIANADTPEKALQRKYHIKIAGYAQRTGKRIFVQPLFFERGETPVFTAADRKYDIHFRNAWRETDEISIMLPAGYELEKAENPGNMDFGKAGSYKLTLAVRGGKELLCNRDLTFGSDQRIFFSRDAYKQVKAVFDEIDNHDKHMLALKLQQTPAPTGGAQ